MDGACEYLRAVTRLECPLRHAQFRKVSAGLARMINDNPSTVCPSSPEGLYIQNDRPPMDSVAANLRLVRLRHPAVDQTESTGKF